MRHLSRDDEQDSHRRATSTRARSGLRLSVPSGFARSRPRTTMPVVVVLDNVRSLYNTGAFFRAGDACGIERLVLCGLTPRPDQGGRQRRAIAKTALGAELVVPWQYEPDTAT